ncbi:MAG: hypothetical protein D6814_07095 [Calditrichaeota bacterium]|nr:MAG: hypothetical protein D6814_07095 [Calditrichota bacterium]
MKGKQPGYSLFYARHPSKTPSFEAGLTEIKNPSLRNLARTIDRLAENILRGKTTRALPTIVALLDSVNYRLLRRREMAPADLRLLLHWKSALDRLRCTLLGVEVKYTVSDTALTELQLTYVTIHSVSGLDGKGKTQIYFGGLDQGWAVNEGFDKRFPLQLDEPYRLLTPRKITFTTPQALYGLENARVDKPIMFFIIHRSPDREKSFVHRTTVRLSFAPRFLTEVLTPIVRIVPGARLAIRLKNFSRDGVTDTVKVAGDLATSLGGAFRLSHKEATYVDTLFIIWKDGIKNGDYVVPLKIHGIKVAQFAARKFDLQADTTRKVGIISGVPHSILFETLRRMGIKYEKIDLQRDFQQQTSGLDVLIVDHRALSFLPKLKKFRKSLDEFVQRGGHLLILAQDAAVWNASPLWNGLRLTENQRLDETVPVAMQDTHTFLVGPNRIGETDWEHWLFRRGYCTLTGSAVKDAEIPIRTREDGIPLVLTRRQKSGRITYVNLALRPQLFNIHAGAFRILANLIAGS